MVDEVYDWDWDCDWSMLSLRHISITLIALTAFRCARGTIPSIYKPPDFNFNHHKLVAWKTTRRTRDLYYVDVKLCLPHIVSITEYALPQLPHLKDLLGFALQQPWPSALWPSKPRTISKSWKWKISGKIFTNLSRPWRVPETSAMIVGLSLKSLPYEVSVCS